MKLLAFLLVAVSCTAAEPVEVPLSEIWALDMPGTKDVRRLADGETKGYVEEIRRGLADLSKPVNDLAFVVKGHDLDALRGAHSVLIGGDKPPTSVSHPSSLVVFAGESNRYFEIRSVRCAGSQILINYCFVPHETKELTTHFAIVPLGSLASGKYEAQFKSTSLPQEAVVAGFRPLTESQRSGLLCGSVSFRITPVRSK